MGQFEDSIYKSAPLSGNTKRHQLFYSHHQAKGILMAKESNTQGDVVNMNLRKGAEAERNRILAEYDLELLNPLEDCKEGIRSIK
jgi:hypothetical protein